MSQAGMGAMLHALGGGSEQDPKKYIGKTIKHAQFSGDTITIQFEDGVSIKITDEGQSCCESRYITSDDKFEDLIGNKLVEIRIKEYKSTNTDWDGAHEICFLEIVTDKLSVIAETHNEHNGYYGGFGLNIKEVQSANS